MWKCERQQCREWTTQRQAFGLLTSRKLAEALDLSKEDPRIVARYGTATRRFSWTATARRAVPQAC